MNSVELQPLLNALVGEVITSKTIAGNSIALWLSVDPKASNARCLWIDPPWRIETPDRIESSSYGFPREQEDDESDADYRTRFEAACAASDCLKANTVTAAVVDPITSDLTLTFKDKRVLRVFAVDLEYENWHFTDHGARKRYGVWVNGVEVESLNA
ncbi:MAG: hypothetical protein IV097_10300 [Burkholderiaceae bacterium]|nr:hypothetical protein [Burkholderiaceae bacterium]